MTALNVSQTLVESTATNTAPPLRVGWSAAEVMAHSPTAPLRVMQVFAEAVIYNGPLPVTVALPAEPRVFLSWSDDRGRSFSNPVGASPGAIGEYRTSVQWRRLGMARDRVFQVEWSSPVITALQGAWVDATPAES